MTSSDSLVKVAPTPFHPKRLLEDDLDVGDVVAVPEAREGGVGKAHHQHVLHTPKISNLFHR